MKNNLTFRENTLMQFAIMTSIDNTKDFLNNCLLANRNTKLSLILMFHNEVEELEQLLTKLKGEIN